MKFNDLAKNVCYLFLRLMEFRFNLMNGGNNEGKRSMLILMKSPKHSTNSKFQFNKLSPDDRSIKLYIIL